MLRRLDELTAELGKLRALTDAPPPTGGVFQAAGEGRALDVYSYNPLHAAAVRVALLPHSRFPRRCDALGDAWAALEVSRQLAALRAGESAAAGRTLGSAREAA